jgi:hypothetical protein
MSDGDAAVGGPGAREPALRASPPIAMQRRVLKAIRQAELRVPPSLPDHVGEAAIMEVLRALDIEAAAQWLINDDTAYEVRPEFAHRAAKHMLAAAFGMTAQGIEAEGRDAQRLGAKPESPVAAGDAP